MEEFKAECQEKLEAQLTKKSEKTEVCSYTSYELCVCV